MALTGSLAPAAPQQTDNDRPSPQFRQWDRNKDGRLSQAELPNALQANFARVDTNSDGFISPDEDNAFRSRVRPAGRRQQNQNRRLPDNVKALRNLEYVENGHERHRLDLYLPDNDQPADSAKRPLVIWIHGGGWRAGSKDNCPAIPLATQGFAVASINYRLSGHAIFPAQIHDCKAAVRWLRANADQYGIDPDRIGVWGSSAGGHLVALLGTSGDVQSLEGDIGITSHSSRVQAVCDWFGPTDFLLMNKHAEGKGRLDHDAATSPESLLIGAPIQQHPDKTKVASPLTYVSQDDPPFYIVHGDADTLVPLAQSQLLQQSLENADVSVSLTVVKDAGHGRFRDPQITEDCFRFFHKQLQPQAAESNTKTGNE
jgi:acetyl esterase/lipase